MSCYNQLLAVPRDSVNANGKIEYDIIGRYWDGIEKKDPLAIPVPCGKCIGCRLDYSRQWADRMMLEMEDCKKGVFVTLTYDNDHVPFTETEDGEFGALTLDKRDLQLFFKRLRKRFSDVKIRYYAAGEYGTNTFRPHYHAIVFGMSLEDFPDRMELGRNELGQIHYTSTILSDTWQNGFVVLAPVTWETCAYVSRYVQKKVFQGLNVFVDTFGAEPEFSLMSRRPGIGGNVFENHPSRSDTSVWYPPGRPQGIRPGRYYRKKMDLLFPENVDKIKAERKKFARDSTLLKLQQTDLSFIEQLEVEENAKLQSAKVLRRKF